MMSKKSGEEVFALDLLGIKLTQRGRGSVGTSRVISFNAGFMWISEMPNLLLLSGVGR